GHMERWLRHEAYRPRAEAPDGWTTRRGGARPPAVLAPTPENAALALELCRNQLACVASRRINVGCDETFELGKGRSRDEVARRGRGPVYLEHLRRIVEPLRAEGCEVLFWGDVLRSHPECVAELPRAGVVALAWHYEAPLDPAIVPDAAREVAADLGFDLETLRGFAVQGAPFAEAGIPFWVCPGLSTWNSFVGRLANARANLRDAAHHGLAQGAGGFLVTDWGDHGHHQPPAVSLLPLADAASVAWCLETNRDVDDAALAHAADALLLEDEAGVLGDVLVRAGGAYARTGAFAVNASPLFAALVPPGPLGVLGAPDRDALAAVVRELEACLGALPDARSHAPDAEALRAELDAALRLARHGAWRLARDHGLPAPDDAALHADLGDAIARQRAAWLLRSRPGGLADSLARLERAQRACAPGG
ncbi:MAG: glycoside hydrolase, partial [Myxococcota bacterium]|nr:glycoside hydrolase [Myxococcota bacterium]